MLVLKTARTEIEPDWIPEIFTPLEKNWKIKSKSTYVSDTLFNARAAKI